MGVRGLELAVFGLELQWKNFVYAIYDSGHSCQLFVACVGK